MSTDTSPASFPTVYVLAWEDVPHGRDRGRFLAAQISELGEPVTIDEGEALADLLEDLGILELHPDDRFRVPILDLQGWKPYLAQVRAQLAEGDALAAPGPRGPRRQVRAIAPSATWT